MSERIRAAAVEQATALMRRVQESERERDAATRALADLQAHAQQSTTAAQHEQQLVQQAAQQAEASAAEARALARRHEDELARMAAHLRDQEKVWVGRVGARRPPARVA